MDEDPLRSAEHAIWLALPHAVASTAIDVVMDYFPVAGAEILLADYPNTFLIPVASGLDPLRVDNTTAGRAFAAQRTVVEESDGADRPHRAHLPLTVHGDRLGVISLTSLLPFRPDELEQFAAIAVVLARALKLADFSTDLYRRIRRRHRLTLAAEMQWDLLPGRSTAREEYTLAGQLEPAYAVSGDNYDWAATADRLTLTVTNGSGQGTQAALLTHLAISAMRNARRSGAGILDQATLANEVIYSHHGGHQQLETLLLEFEVASGRVRAVDAGSPQTLRMRGSKVEPVEFSAQMPLGMFYDTVYTEESFFVEPGDRLFIVSDGVHGALSPGGVAYGSSALPRALRDTLLQGPLEAVRNLSRNLLDYHEGADLRDDAVVLCLDWNGSPAGS
ncbi:PP2C family protein-serine/threonine phosphatase [Spirillospora sp. NPDC048911]|uniref:PP2C family protein-serine/threonine phosphatase n=1 Tax=Spirillospora sp. NPDC048911 TaxID=3364527 RepID=UPI003723D75E